MNAKPANEPGRKVRPMRWWIPLLVLIVTVTTIFLLREAPELPIIKKILFGMLTVLASVLLMLLWFLFLSAFSWRTRLLTLVAVVVVGYGFSRLVRIDGSMDGSGRPRVVWKWTPRSSGEVKTGQAVMIPLKSATNLEAALAYPGLLGNERDGLVRGIQLERDWTAHPPQQLWRQPVGLGWAGFAVTGSRAVTQEQRDENELVVAYELANGSTIWMHTNHARFSEKMGGDGPRSTPTILDGRVYAMGATGILDCLDLTNGKVIWSRDALGENHLPNLIFGKSCAPLVVDNLVIVNGGETNGPTLLAYRVEDGAPAWKSGTDKASYASPTLTTLGGKRQILSVNASSVTAHNIADGKIIWQYDWQKWGPRCAQPVTLDGDRIFLSAGFGVGCSLLQIKTNAAGEFSATELWKNLRLKTQFSTAVARSNFVYGLDEGVLACINLTTGERAWKDGHYGFGQILMVDDLLLVQTENGPVALVEATPTEFHEVAKFSALSSKTWNNPALAGDFYIARNDQEAVCYRLPLCKSPGR